MEAEKLKEQAKNFEKQAENIKLQVNTSQEQSQQLEETLNSVKISVGKLEEKINDSEKNVQDFSQKSQEIQEKMISMDKDIKNMKDSLVSNVETIGIFSGIVAFVIGTLELVNGSSVVGTGLLILTLMGGLTAALAVFSLLLHMSDNKKQRKKRIKATICVIAGSLFLSVGAVVLAYFIVPKV